MTISDLLTLIGILFAIIAFISERSREYIILKLSNIEIAIVLVLFIYIHFLLSYQWWADKFKFLRHFEIEGLPTPNAWAYIISISILFYFVWKIFFGQFPLSRKRQLISYYKKLLLRNDIPFLAQLVEKYHLHQIIKFLRKKKTIKIENRTGLERLYLQKYLEAYSKAIKGRNLIYGDIIYHNITLDETFVDNIANSNPYLFSQIIQELNEQNLEEDCFVNRYLKILMTNKNSNFFREIRNNQDLGRFYSYSIDEERPILYALFNDIRVCTINRAWYGVGDAAILEMQKEAKKEYSVLREPDKEPESDTTWSFRITVAIWYFDIMVREAIVQNIDDHMWMYYYFHFVSLLILNMQELPFENSDINRYSRNFDLIEIIFSKMIDWKKVIIKSKNNKLSKSVYDCIGQCVYEVATTNKLREDDKNYLIDQVWADLISTFGEDDISRDIADEIINHGFNMFKCPSINFKNDQHFDNYKCKMYLSVLRKLWDKRDIATLTGEVGNRATNFKKNIIDVLIPNM